MHVPRMPFAYALILWLLFLLPSAPAASSRAQRALGLRAMAASGSAVGQRRVFLPVVPVIHPFRLDLIGQTGGAMNALAVTDRFLYAGIGPRPVSYTHLDVYKRQDRRRMRVGIGCSWASPMGWAGHAGRSPWIRTGLPTEQAYHLSLIHI